MAFGVQSFRKPRIPAPLNLGVSLVRIPSDIQYLALVQKEGKVTGSNVVRKIGARQKRKRNVRETIKDGGMRD